MCSLATLVSAEGTVSDSDVINEVITLSLRELGRLPKRKFCSFPAALEAGPEGRTRAVEALYRGAATWCADHSIKYGHERAFDHWTKDQAVQSPAALAAGPDGTCLDFALFGAALMARVGLLPLVCILSLPSGRCHAISAVHLFQARDGTAPILAMRTLREEVKQYRVLPVDWTAIVPGYLSESGASPLVFAAAIDEAKKHVVMAEAPSFVLDVDSAWKRGYHPNSALKRKRIRELLPVTDFSQEIAGRARGFVGRETLLQAIEAWQCDPGSEPIFWLTGDMGVGKTALASVVAMKGRLLAAHFCRAGEESRTDARAVAMSIASQLIESVPLYFSRLAQRDYLSVLRASTDTVLRTLLIDALPLLGEQAPDCLIVIDALDEATVDGQNVLAKFIGGDLMAALRTRPDSYRILVTSRPDPVVMMAMGQAPSYELRPGDTGNIEDIKTFARTHLTARATDSGTLESWTNDIAEKSEGLFSYAASAVLLVRRGQSPDDLASGQMRLCREYFNVCYLKHGDISAYSRQAGPLLAVVLAARGPLPISIVAATLDTTPNMLVAELDRLYLVLQQEAGAVRTRYQYLVEWLTSAELAGPYVVSRQAGHDRLAKACWHLVMTGAPVVDDGGYARRHLAEHLFEAGDWPRLLLLVRDLRVDVFGQWVAEGRMRIGVQVLRGLVRHLDGIAPGSVAGCELSAQIGRLHLIQGEYEQAESWLNQCLAQTSPLSRHGQRAVALHELGSIALYRADHGRARALYEEALRLVRDGPQVEHGEIAANLLGLATLASTRKSLELASEAVEHARQAADFMHEAAAERMVAEAHKMLDDLAAARSHAARAIFICDTHDVGPEPARCRLIAASVEYYVALLAGDGLGAVSDRYRLAHDVAERAGHFHASAQAMIGLGRCALAENRVRDAESIWFDLDHSLASGQHLDSTAAVCLGLAAVRQQDGDPVGAEAGYRRALTICDALPDWLAPERLRALSGLGAVHWHTGRERAAEVMWRDALRAAEAMPLLSKITKLNIERARKSRMATPW